MPLRSDTLGRPPNGVSVSGHPFLEGHVSDLDLYITTSTMQERKQMFRCSRLGVLTEHLGHPHDMVATGHEIIQLDFLLC